MSTKTAALAGSAARRKGSMMGTPRQAGSLWTAFERRHQPRISVHRVSNMLPEDATGNYPQQFSDLLDLERDRVWQSVEYYEGLEGQALREYDSLSALHGSPFSRTAEYLISLGYDADEVVAVGAASRARNEVVRQRAQQFIDEYGED